MQTASNAKTFDVWFPQGGGLCLLLEHGGTLEVSRSGLDRAGWAGVAATAIVDELASLKRIAFARPPGGPYVPLLRVSVLGSMTLRAEYGMATGEHFSPELACDQQWGRT